MPKQTQSMFFDPALERDAVRKKLMAKQLMDKGSAENKTEMVSGIAVNKSPWEFMSQSADKFYGQYMDEKADKQLSDVDAKRAQMYQQVLSQMGNDPMAAASVMAQDPSLGADAMRMYQDVLGQKAEDKRYYAGLENDLQKSAMDRQYEDMKFEREANLKRELAAMRNKGGQLVPELNPETGQFEMVQSNAPRKLSANEQKNFYEQKAKTDSVRNALGVLDQVQTIAKDPRYTGMGAGAMAYANRIPLVGNFIDDQKAANTTSIDNLLKELAYSRLQSTFPGAISNSERESLEKLQALSNYSQPEQEKIIEEARKVLNRQASISAEMQKGIVSGEVYTADPMAPVQTMAPIQSTPQTDIRARLQAAGIPPERIEAYIKAKGLE